MSDNCDACGHERKYHAIPEHHVLRTAHCTKKGCDCQAYWDRREASQ